MNAIGKAREGVGVRSGAVTLFDACLLMGSCLLTSPCLLTSQSAAAQTLAEVVRTVADGSPAIARARARADAAGAGVDVARAGARPQLSINGNVLRGTRGANAQAGFDQTVDTDLSLLFPVYSGGRVKNGIRAASARADAAVDTLDQTRADAVADAINAYLDVIRDRAALQLAERSVGLLEQVLQGARRQFEAGDSTRTDIAQSRARLGLSRARVETARAVVLASEARFDQLVGVMPGTLGAAPPLTLPAIEPDAIVEVAVHRSPAVTAAEAGARAARADVFVARAAGRPQLSTTVSGQFHDYRASYAGSGVQQGAGGRATASVLVPVYSGGRIGAETRRASAFVAEASGAGELARRETAAGARRAVIDYRAQLALVALDEERAAASREALAGVQTEQRAGQRTILDVLDATAELLEAETGMLNSRHDAYAAAVGVLRSVDRLDCLAAPGADTCESAVLTK